MQPTIFRLISVLWLVGYSLDIGTSIKTSKYVASYSVEISHTNMTANFRDWESDLAIMFYTPWCKYCKQMSPIWDQIATLSSKTKDLVVGKFNCESPSQNVKICQHLGVDRYPSLYFLGYGSFHQAPKNGFIFGENKQPRVARFTADLYPEAIYDWIRMLTMISKSQRMYDDIKGVFTGKSRSSGKIEALKSRVRIVK